MGLRIGLLIVIATMLFLVTGCATIQSSIVGWNGNSPTLTLKDGTSITVLGNPLITCYDKQGTKVAEGYFVQVANGYLIIDEYGYRYVQIRNVPGIYCTLNRNDNE